MLVLMGVFLKCVVCNGDVDVIFFFQQDESFGYG